MQAGASSYLSVVLIVLRIAYVDTVPIKLIYSHLKVKTPTAFTCLYGIRERPKLSS